MELRHLRYFVAVAEERHFRRAGERLHVAQPAVSDQIRKLEEELGVRLLDRTQRRVELTNAGAALLDEARRVLEQAEVAKMAAQGARHGTVSRLRIGFVSASLPASVPQVLQRLASSAPQLVTSMQEGPALELIDAVRAGRLDAAIVSLPAPTAGLRVTVLGRQRAVAAVPLRHPRAASGRLRLDQVAPERILMLPREANRGFFDAVVASCRGAGLAPTLVEIPGGQVEHLLLAVAAGAGMALLPESVTGRYVAPGVQFVPLEGDQPAFEAAAVTRRDSAHLPTAGLVRALERIREPLVVVSEANAA